MNIAISNIAWDKQEDDLVLSVLKKYKVNGIELAPTKIWQDPIKVSEKEIKKYRDYWNRNNIQIVAMQSLLFGHPELTIFQNKEDRKKTIDYLKEIIRIASMLGIKVLVFGSPKNRQTYGLSAKTVQQIACEFFIKLGDIAKKHDLFFCIEPNPKIYGTDFINNTNQAIDLVKLVNHPNFRLHLDSSTMIINHENYDNAIKKSISYIEHFHVSQPNLDVVVNNKTDHKIIAKSLKEAGYKKWVSIEMKSGLGPNAENVEKALSFTTSIYR